MPSISSCNSRECIYIIKCNKCNHFYVGETKRTIKERLSEHISKIKRSVILASTNFEELEGFLEKNKDCFYLYQHFSKEHDLKTDLSFQIFVNNFKFFRLRLETDLIFCLQTQYPSGLNRNISHLKYINAYIIPPLK